MRLLCLLGISDAIIMWNLEPTVTDRREVMWNLELVALRAMKNFPINNYY